MSSLSFAQENNTHLTLINSDTLFQISIEELIDDSVKISFLGQSQWIKVDSILEIRKIKKSKFWQGAGIGFLGGAVMGGVIGRASYKKSAPSSGNFNFSLGPGFNTFFGAVIGGITGTLVGGVVGASYGKDELYDLSQKKLEQKIEIIESFIAKKNKD
jgi:hypothetical protein